MFQFQTGAIIGAAIWYMLPAVIAVSIPKWCDYRSRPNIRSPSLMEFQFQNGAIIGH